MKKPIIAANWKMNKTVSETEEFIKKLSAKDIPEHIEAVVCPPFIGLKDAVKLKQGTAIKVGAQNMHFEEHGAYTGEVSPVMLSDLQVDYVILGHSERRQLFGETDEVINKKVHAAFKYGLYPILCVGETLEQMEAGDTEVLIQKQLELGLAWLSANQVADMVIAYEPVWAIGTGKSSNPELANQTIKQIRKYIQDIYDTSTAKSVRIQYGGSVKPENIKDYLKQSDIDGALVGGASLQVESFYKLLV
ncbi:triose-phosphate isomerase [Desulfuribacillus alkaliarsenatis]|uniref:Triosephosphate isomerase n=1 Tax=Desulfuribacillus alkaliarsenatis TaxID=766136 RepID=A0A1E5G434_9FIRM|nr:triose-phosphate isomerase [Desulfuribacillus alkaliarsenatis]OEF97851.1 triose-phosphate isomerase [Desulfuribacillus alkaliarsenatis]